LTTSTYSLPYAVRVLTKISIVVFGGKGLVRVLDSIKGIIP